MAIFRERPYCGFHFLVDLGDGASDGPQAGFSEVSGLGASVDVSDYRAGNERESTLRKLPGMTKFGEVTLKRGLIGSTQLWQWFKTVADGAPERRNVTIQLLDESRTSVVMTWKLRQALPIRYEGPKLTATGSEVAIESLTLAIEGLEVE